MRHADDTLETYLAQIVSGAPVREPEPGIEPMLRVAQQLHQIGNVEPSPAAVERIRMTLRRATVREAAARPAVPQFGRWRRPAIGVAFAVVLLALGTTSALAAPSALPDSPLYSVRSWRESVQLQLAGNSAQRAVLYANFAGERTTQLRQLAGHKAVDPGLVTTLLRDITARVQRANQEAHDDGQAAQSAVRGVEGQIDNQLSQLQQDGEFSGDAAAQLTDTLRVVQSGQSGQSGASNSNSDSSNGNSNQP